MDALPSVAPRRRNGCVVAIVVVVFGLPGLWFALQIYVNYGAGEFARDIQRRESHQLRVLKRLPFGTPVPWDPGAAVQDPGRDAVLSYKLSRLPFRNEVEFFICGDACPSWRPHEAIVTSLGFMAIDPTHNLCHTERDRFRFAGWNLREAALSQDEGGIDCRFVGTRDGVRITVETFKGEPSDLRRQVAIEGSSADR